MPSIRPGTRLGRYEIVTHIAAGGMANVYLGRALGVAGFQRLVAIKLLHPHVAADRQFITMFLDEARLAARVRHPNVVATLDLQHGADGHYLVMEYVEGDSLLGLLRQTAKLNKPMPAGIAIRIMLETLHGLHAAHELTGDQGEPLHLVHRDVSPHNILVGADGVTRLTDFGIARAEERISHTRDGQVKGKLSYMAPEQTGSEPVDRRADVFTAGIVLWECLASKRLFRGQTDAEALRQLLEAPIPRLRDVAPGYPPALDEVCARALRRDPDERFDNAADFAEALEEAAEPLGIATPRALGAYVREIAAEMLESVDRRVRAWNDGARVMTAPSLEQGEPGDTSVRMTISAPSSNGAQLVPLLPESTEARRRRPLWVGLGAAALVLVGASVATVTLLVASRAGHEPEHAAATAAPTVTAPVAKADPTATTTEAPATTSVSVQDLPSETPPPRPAVHHPHAQVKPPSPPPVASAPSAAASARTPPAPPPPATGGAFNPEAM